MNGGQGAPLDDLVTESGRRIALRRVLDGGVRRLLGGGIVDGGRPVPDYVTAALRELAGNEQVKPVECTTGELQFEITPAGQDLYDELLLGPQVAVEPGTPPPPARLHRTPQPPEKQWPELAFLLDANPPWTLTASDSGVVTGTCRDGESSESLWVVNDQRAGYISRPHQWSDPACTFRGPLRRLITFLSASESERSV